MDNYSLAKSALRRNEERSPAYRTFVQDRVSISESRRQNLADHFILPIQRVTRYTLLLQDLLRHTDSDHADYPDLEQSCQLMKDLASKINEVKRKEETFTKLFEIQKEVENCPVIPLPLPEVKHENETETFSSFLFFFFFFSSPPWFLLTENMSLI